MSNLGPPLSVLKGLRNMRIPIIFHFKGLHNMRIPIITLFKDGDMRISITVPLKGRRFVAGRA